MNLLNLSVVTVQSTLTTLKFGTFPNGSQKADNYQVDLQHNYSLGGHLKQSYL
jgi:hypothetical protein